jgi:hypothetical protein
MAEFSPLSSKASQRAIKAASSVNSQLMKGLAAMGTRFVLLDL